MHFNRLLLFLFSFSALWAQAQDIPLSTNNEALYEFIDELAAEHYITVNQVVKPYSRQQVYQWMEEAEFYYYQMTKRQREEWQFYKDNLLWQNDKDGEKNPWHLLEREYGALSLAPVGIFSSSEAMDFALKPVLGSKFYLNSAGLKYHRNVGIAMDMTVKNWGFYANVQEIAESERLLSKEYLVNERGANYKTVDYSDMLGGVSYANDWISLAMVKDYVEWGTHQHGANIISDRAPSFAHIKMKLKPVDWFEMNYMHGWLVSDVIDSTESYTMSTGDRRDVMHGKFIASNMFTVYPFKTLGLSAGNSIIYSADNAKLQYLNPFMFYKSVDHTYNSTESYGKNTGQNSQMFFDISVRSIKKVFLYYTLFVDELKIARWKEEDEHNFYSYKTGAKFTQLIPNTSFGLEYTHTVPITYQHDVTTTTYESNSFNMGHYLRDNAEELYFYFHYRPFKNWRFKLDYTFIRKGEEYGYQRYSEDLTRHPFIEEVKYQNAIWTLMSEYQLAYDLFFYLSVGHSNPTGDDVDIYLPPSQRKKEMQFNFGFNMGF